MINTEAFWKRENTMTGILLNIIISFMVYSRQTHCASFCDQRQSGYYADPTTCYKFYHCDQYGVAFSHDCAAGLIWNDEVLVCVTDPFNGNCLPTVSANRACVSITYCVKQSKRYSGPETGNATLTDSMVGCARACSQITNHCQSFNFFPDQKICEMFSEVHSSDFIGDKSCVFGQKCLGAID